MIWSAPSFKAKGKLSALVANFDLPGTFSNISHKPVTLSLNLIGQTVYSNSNYNYYCFNG